MIISQFWVTLVKLVTLYLYNYEIVNPLAVSMNKWQNWVIDLIEIF